MQTVYVVEPEPMTRRGLVLTLQAEPGLEVEGEAATGAAALAYLKAHTPDLVTLEVDLPDVNGLDVMLRLHRQQPTLRMLAMARQDEAICAEQVLRAGGRGYVVQNEPIPAIITAIRWVLAGHYYVSERVTDELYEAIAGSKDPLIPLPSDVLSHREMELFKLIGQGLTTQAIADRMQVTVTTIESYRNRAKEKLNVTRTSDLLHQAAKWAHDDRVCYSWQGCRKGA